MAEDEEGRGDLGRGDLAAVDRLLGEGEAGADDARGGGEGGLGPVGRGDAEAVLGEQPQPGAEGQAERDAGAEGLEEGVAPAGGGLVRAGAVGRAGFVSANW